MPSKSDAFLAACNLVCHLCLMFSRLLTDFVLSAFGLDSVWSCLLKCILQTVVAVCGYDCIFATCHLDYYTMKTLLIMRVFFS